jgi:hypothetical protein
MKSGVNDRTSVRNFYKLFEVSFSILESDKYNRRAQPPLLPFYFLRASMKRVRPGW